MEDISAAESSGDETNVTQKVVAFKRRVEPIPSTSGKNQCVAGMLAGVQEQGQDAVEKPVSVRYKEMFRNGRPTSYVEKAEQLQLTQKNSIAFFSEAGLVEKFGATTVFYCRLGVDNFSQTLKIYVKKENSNASTPTILPIPFGEIGVILQHIKLMLMDIDESVRAGNPIYRYPTGSLIEPRAIEFWQHDDVWYSDSMKFRMRFVNVRKDRYFFYLNAPCDNSRFDGYFGPKIQLCRADLDGFVKTMESIVAKVDPDDI